MDQSIILSNDFLSSTIRKIPIHKTKGIYELNQLYREISLIDARFIFKNFGKVYKYERNSLSEAVKYNNIISHFISKNYHCLVEFNRQILLLDNKGVTIFKYTTYYDIKTLIFDVDRDVQLQKKFYEFFILDTNDNLHHLAISDKQYIDIIIDTNISKIVDCFYGIIFYLKNGKLYKRFYKSGIGQRINDLIINVVNQVNTFKF